MLICDHLPRRNNPLPKPPPRGGGGAVVAAGAEFDAAADDAEVEPVDEAAVAALLAEIAHASRMTGALQRAFNQRPKPVTQSQ